MRITRLQITNYKSFAASTEIQLRSGFNVVVGQNNAGKTAFAEALTLNFVDNPTRTLTTKPTPEARPDPKSRVRLSFTFQSKEFLTLLHNHLSDFRVAMDRSQEVQSQINSFLHAATTDPVEFTAEYYSNNQIGPAFLSSLRQIRDYNCSIRFTTSADGGQLLQADDSRTSINRESEFGILLATLLKPRIYLFRAERLNLSQSLMGNTRELKSDASNLPQVLNLLQGSNPSRFDRLNAHLQTIFPSITRITVPPISQNEARILVWSVDPASERDDLAMSLADSGTGIGQVLAMLYVVITSDYPKVIVIDEPQSFLHPGAISKLLDVLGEYPQHQYIFTTHSPTVAAAARSGTLLLLRNTQGQTEIEVVDASETESLRHVLSEVGARLSDVFGADRILWVEGRTEEECFSLIWTSALKRPLLGSVILGVTSTAEFRPKDARRTLQIYQRLSQSRGLLPPAVGFIFDRDGRSATEQSDLIRESKGAVSFLGRRMYENYLLDSNAIVAVASHIPGFSDLTPTNVAAWIEGHAWDSRYWEEAVPEAERSSERLSREVDAASLLSDLFSDLSDSKAIYRKVEHGVALTRWFLDNQPEALSEVIELLKPVLDSTT